MICSHCVLDPVLDLIQREDGLAAFLKHSLPLVNHDCHWNSASGLFGQNGGRHMIGQLVKVGMRGEPFAQFLS